MVSTPGSRLRVILLGLALPFVPIGSAAAADFFVATDGSDSAPGTESAPFRTIRRAVDAARNPGDTVWIRGGVYPANNWANQLNFQHSGAEGAPITFRAYPGELPILDGQELWDDGASGVEIVEPAAGPVSYIRVIGLVAKNWGTSGFSNGWPTEKNNLASSNIEFIHCIADHNGLNGFSFAGASNFRLEGSIALHNGTRLPSWSSGVSLYEVTGQNVIDGNVSFENTDVSNNRSDGSGFIFDEQSTHGYLVNNIAFRNGGSCLRVTKSSNITLMNNTCITNGQDPNLQFKNEIYLSEQQSGQGTSIYNIVGIAGWGNPIDGQGYNQFFSGREGNNVWLNNTAPFVSGTGAIDFHLVASATQLIDRGRAQDAPTTDNGFDFRCIKQQGGQELNWWQYAIDYDYVASVGGVAGCFNRGVRPTGSGIDIGALEYNAAPAGCTGDSECSSSDSCRRSLCAPGAECLTLPIEGCCTGDTHCVDADPCTADVCDTAASSCSKALDLSCFQDPSGVFSMDDYGYVTACNWGGYSWTAAGPEGEAGVNGTTSTIQSTGENLCYSGVVAAHEDYGGYAMLGINIKQESGSNKPAENTTLGGEGLNISVVNERYSPMRVQLQDAENVNRWCVELTGTGGFHPWSSFNTHCWSPDEGTYYAGEPISVIAVTVPGHNVDDLPFEFCLNQAVPAGEQCLVEPGTATAANTGGDDGAETGDSGDTASSGAEGGNGGPGTAGLGPETNEGGCACASDPERRPAAAWGLAIFAVAAWRRRRSGAAR